VSLGDVFFTNFQVLVLAGPKEVKTLFRYFILSLLKNCLQPLQIDPISVLANHLKQYLAIDA